MTETDTLRDRLRRISAEEPADGCGLMEYLRWLGRRSEVEVQLRSAAGNRTGAIPVPGMMEETNHRCPGCGEEWYADGEEGQDRCPNCGEPAGDFHETM